MNTSGKFDFKYGRIEVKDILPSTNGTWPTIWTLPTSWIYGDWPKSGEIDIMEHSEKYGYGHVFDTIHTEAYNHTNGTQQGEGVTYEDVTNTFHAICPRNGTLTIWIGITMMCWFSLLKFK